MKKKKNYYTLKNVVFIYDYKLLLPMSMWLVIIVLDIASIVGSVVGKSDEQCQNTMQTAEYYFYSRMVSTRFQRWQNQQRPI